ncbi:hypothetical protein DM02DRAFT_547366 [Periconia macrospinosa]|uniref:Heterokaryon incompatibility domain-containing protein n=1 Tax=Periconia macrospinosa TaxID=97972 RepID=A0A2V1CY51_9PLEO|nr:hypothetical protein DM02DRAFT_547366 [Periconia macrospinosa]
MRLLKREGEDIFSLTKDLLGDDEIPDYAILSHTWGEEEVLFQDLNGEAYKSKKGYRKIQFCGAQAAKDQLQYFWSDTCCTIVPTFVVW